MRQESAFERQWSKIAALEPGSILLERAFSRNGLGRSLLFRSPKKIIEARDASEIRTGLLAIETASSEGLGVAGYISYEAGHALEPSLADLAKATELPRATVSMRPEPTGFASSSHSFCWKPAYFRSGMPTSRPCASAV